MNVSKPILLFDGTCNLCNRWVNFVIRKDHHQKILFATLQSEGGQKALRNAVLQDKQVDSIVFMKDDIIYLKSNAIFEILDTIGGFWKLFNLFILVPRPFRDWIYDRIAKNRYRIYGKRDDCMVPGPGVKNRFLE